MANSRRGIKIAVLILGILSFNFICRKGPKTVDPETVGISKERLARVIPVIEEEIARGEIPGAVLLVARKGKIVMRRAFGYAELVPEKKIMKPDMIFDLASLTKPMATATSIMILLEQGKLRLLDPVIDFIPNFSRYVYPDSTDTTYTATDTTTAIPDSIDTTPDSTEAENARLYHLLTHTSGYMPYFNADSIKALYGYPCVTDTMVKFVAAQAKLNPPGEEFHYSCLGYITLAKIIKDVSGMNVHQFSQKYIFEPLKMKHTGYIPQIGEAKPDSHAKLIKKYKDKLVPTEVIEGIPLIGTVHDPLARLQGGISGNAGLFSNVDDMFIFAQLLLNGGQYDGTRILGPLTVKRMTAIYFRTKESGRGLGWDLSSPYSSNGGDIFPEGGFGHTGYTGTSLWIDPATKTIVILLTNRVHPYDEGSVVRFRSLVANIVAGAIIKE